MDRSNPRYILRNWMAVEAYEAAERGDYGPVAAVHKLLCNPYDDQAICSAWTQHMRAQSQNC